MTFDDLDTIAANSFTDFHTKGLDYLCLLRTPVLTLKAYFYDDHAAETSPEVVCPHDHRYPFSTTVLSGRSEHFRYRWDLLRGDLHQQFAWRTPLNGGSGFHHLGEMFLRRRATEHYRAGQTYWCEADEIHTIAIRTPGTVLLLAQHADVVPIDQPTSTFVPGSDREPPSIAGLYERMPLARAESLLGVVKGLLQP